LELAGLKFNLGVRDRASGNDKAVAIESAEFPDWLSAYLGCFNHGNMLSHLDMAFAVFGGEFVKALHAIATFLNAGTHRLRLLMVVEEFVAQHLKIEYGVQDEADQLYSEECTKYFTLWSDISTPSRKRSDKKKKQRNMKQDA